MSSSWEKELVLCLFTYRIQYGSTMVPAEQSFMLEVEFADQLWDAFNAKIVAWTMLGKFGSPSRMPVIDFHTALTKSGRRTW